MVTVIKNWLNAYSEAVLEAERRVGVSFALN